MNDATDPKEQLLIRELKKGSRRAFDEIYRMYARRLLAYSRQYTKRMEDAEEIVQDVFVRLWNNRESIRQEETLRSLLFIMSKHLLINAYRSQVNDAVYEDYVACQAELSTADAAHHVEYEDFVLALRNALHELPPTQRRAIELVRLRGYSNKEAATMMSLSEQTIKNQLSLGLKALKEKLGKGFVPLWLLWLVN